MMADELPILKGILNGVVDYHNARECRRRFLRPAAARPSAADTCRPTLQLTCPFFVTAVRFGRVPKREKARILAAMQQSSNSRSLEKAVSAELEDEQRLLATVVRAHLDTCDFTREKVEPMLQRAREQPSYTACPPTLVNIIFYFFSKRCSISNITINFHLSLQACPLNPNPQPLTGQQELLQDFSKRFSPAIRGVVEFAKRIPGFSLLAQDDQVTLLKAGVFEVLLVRLACMFDAHTSTMICLNGQLLKRDAIHNSSNARFLMDSMFDFAERVNALRLSDAEIGLFCSVVVIAPDRPGLRNTELIDKMHGRLRTALQTVMQQNRPGHPDLCAELMKKVPDLRTLNTLHSEKLLAFKMTEQQQQLQQQQQQQRHHWPTEEDVATNSPSCWSSASDATMDEAKSPLGSVSSTESLCSGEIAALTAADYHRLTPLHHQQQQQTATLQVSQQASSAPLLAATLAGGLCPHRHRANSGSTSSGDDDLASAAHLVHNGLTITPVPRPARSFVTRKLDSPSDSGIESGTEKLDHKLTTSAPTSLCSSPRSSLDDHHVEQHGSESQHHKHHVVEDMPVLKRVLQAPPLYDTNSLMDEAYKPHKKFRALRNKDSEAEPSCSVATAPSSVGGSLSSTHSTLARSLMEGPRMTAEQQKRTDIIHNYIMRGGSETASAPAETPFHSASPTACPYSKSSGSLLVCATPTYHLQQQQQPQQQQHQPTQVAWTTTGVPSSYGTSVITTTTGRRQSPAPTYVLVPNSTSRTPPPPQPAAVVVTRQPEPLHQQQQQSADFPRIYFHPQSPQSTSCVSPTREQGRTSPTSPCTTSGASSAQLPQAKLMELQVDIAADAPLNLSKKSPSPSPRLAKPVPMEV